MSKQLYIDRVGRRYSSAVEGWHPAVIKSLGIREATAEELANESKSVPASTKAAEQTECEGLQRRAGLPRGADNA